MYQDILKMVSFIKKDVSQRENADRGRNWKKTELTTI